MSQESPQPISKPLERVPFGTPAGTVTSLVHRDGAVILENVLNAPQVARITADLDAPLEALHFGSSTTDAGYQAFHGYRTKRMTNVVTLSRTAREDFISNPILLGYITELFKDVCDRFTPARRRSCCTVT